MTDRTCTIEGCTQSDRLIAGVCQRHYSRFQSTGSYGPAERYRAEWGSLCKIEGCHKRTELSGYCKPHGRRLKLYGDPLGQPAPRPERVCSINECAGKHWAKGLCRKHYKRLSEYGRLDLLNLDADARFWAQVDKRGPDECWPWTGATIKGYGHSHANYEHYYAHRRSYEMHIGPIPDGQVVRHACDNPPCVNPAHLITGTQGDNVNDMIARGRGWWQR